MSDNIPFDIQREIIKKVSDIKSLIQFRSVSKPWKSFIDSSEFINGYGARHTEPHRLILSYKTDEVKYICLVDDDHIETLNVQQEIAPFVASPLHKQYDASYVVGACHGLLCLYGIHKSSKKGMLLVWNPSIGKSFGIHVPICGPRPRIGFQTIYGFGVCPVTSDPIVVKVLRHVITPWHAEIFTLSSGVWNVLPSRGLLHESTGVMSSQVVIDRFIYWGVNDATFTDDGESTRNPLVVSFDLITKEFKVVDLPDSLTNQLLTSMNVLVSKLRGSLVVSGYILAERAFGVWVMEHDSSFTKLFSFGKLSSFGTLFSKILGFRKNDESIFETIVNGDLRRTLDVYDPGSHQIKNLGIVVGSSFMDSYKQSLLLLDHPELHIY